MPNRSQAKARRVESDGLAEGRGGLNFSKEPGAANDQSVDTRGGPVRAPGLVNGTAVRRVGEVLNRDRGRLLRGAHAADDGSSAVGLREGKLRRPRVPRGNVSTLHDGHVLWTRSVASRKKQSRSELDLGCAQRKRRQKPSLAPVCPPG
jgi:hypothetical protein